MDADRVKARGPWALVLPEKPKNKSGVLYLPEGNLLERLGHSVALVVSISEGYYEVVKGKRKFTHNDVSPGDRVVFRGHLKEANRVGDKGHCFINVSDIVGVLPPGEDLDLALPYDN